LRLLDEEGCITRCGANGVVREQGTGIVAGVFEHRTAREVLHADGSRTLDPHLHTHCAVANMTRGTDGRWRTLDSGALLRDWRPALSGVYQAVLRDEITRRLGWSWRPLENGLAELTRWPETALREMSQRRRQIEQHLAERGETGADAAQRAAYATREAKTPVRDLDTERAAWRVRLSEHGLPSAELDDILRPGRAVTRELTALEADALLARLAGTRGLTERTNRFTRPQVIRALADELEHGASLGQLRRLADEVWTHDEVVHLDAEHATTRGLVAANDAILEHAKHGRDQRCGMLRAHEIAAAIRDARLPPTDEQAAVIREVSSSGHGIDLIQASAGTGKTTTLGVLAAAYRSAAYHVLGVTPTARAARELEAVGVPSVTIDALAARIDRREPLAPPGPLLLIADENAMAGSRAWSRVVDAARQRNAKIVCCGDANQLDPVPAGGAFHHLARLHPVAHLRTPIRQHEHAEADALRHLHGGNDPEQYLEHKARRRELQLAPSQQSALIDAAAWWSEHALRAGPATAVVITRTNELRGQLNDALRRQHAEHGGLRGPVLEAAGRAFQRGDRVLLRQNDPQLGAANGTRGTVTAIDVTRRTVTVRADDGTSVRLPSTYLDAGKAEHGYCLTAHALQGATVEHALVVSYPDDHSSQWTYTAASRARQTTIHLVIAVEPEPEAPGLEDASLDPLETSRRLAAAMRLDEHDALGRVLGTSSPDVFVEPVDRGLGLDR
jgi:hypothetical protein